MTAMSTVRRSSPRTASPLAPGFSMVELMIAIMILGVGLVMVATVFPVGLDITRDTLQVAITQSAVDAAVATVQAKVPAYKNLDGIVVAPPTDIENATPRVVFADINAMQLTTNGAFDSSPDVALRQGEPDTLAKRDTGYPSASVLVIPPDRKKWTGWNIASGTLNPADLAKSRVFTEHTGWDAELNAQATWHEDTYVLPAQNIPADSFDLIPMTVPIFSRNATVPQRAEMIRVHLTDMVYPPISLETRPGATEFFLPGGSDSIEPLTGDLSSGPANNRYLGRLIADGDPARGETGRRYSWTVIARRAMADRDVRDLMLTVVVLYRGDLTARYARQKGKTGASGYDVRFSLDPSATDIDDYLRIPLPDPEPSTDTRFPQPWLVVLESVDASRGEVLCTAEVAQLLPANSYFVVARADNTLKAGTAHKVLSVTWNGEEYGTTPDNQDYSVLRIASTAGQGARVPVWVFPPPIVARASGSEPPSFGPRSPVAGVALRRVPAP